EELPLSYFRIARIGAAIPITQRRAEIQAFKTRAAVVKGIDAAVGALPAAASPTAIGAGRPLIDGPSLLNAAPFFRRVQPKFPIARFVQTQSGYVVAIATIPTGRIVVGTVAGFFAMNGGVELEIVADRKPDVLNRQSVVRVGVVIIPVLERRRAAVKH